MKKSILMLGLGLVSMTMSAQTVSPFAGAKLDEAAGGEFFLYNVNTGRWLQNNDDNNSAGYWTTRGEMGTRGMIFKVIPRNNGDDGAMQLNPQFGHNHSMNINGFYLDTGAEVSTYYFEATDQDGVSNAYMISGDNNGDYPYLTVNDEGWLDLTQNDAATNNVWQLVTKAERLKYMQDHATSTSPVDATWLINGATFAFQDERNGSWKSSTTKTYNDNMGTGDAISGDGDTHNNSVREFYNFETVSMTQTISGLPNGTYELSVQGYYRDGGSESRSNCTSPDFHYVVDQQIAGTEDIKAYYFANGARHNLMSILDDSQDAGVAGFDFNALMTNGDGNAEGSGQFVPNSTNQASTAFFNGHYKNEPIKATVADGTLTLGVRKDEGVVPDNWIVVDNFTLKYLGSDVDVTEVKKDLQQSITDAEGVSLSSTDAVNRAFAEALATAKNMLSSDDAAAIAAAYTSLKDALQTLKDTYANATLLKQTLDKAKAVGVTGDAVDNAADKLVNATTNDELNNALGTLRIARKIFAADKAENVFAGNAPAAGEFYLYNVGTKRFFCGGGDWGAHAYVGFPGIPVTLVATETEGSFRIDTQLQNGNGQHFLNYGGYCDCETNDAWSFKDLGNGKYAIWRTGASDSEKENGNMYLGYRPGTYGNIDTDMTGFEDEGNQWILVTKDDRDQLIANASEQNPVDVSYMIKMPNFNQREFAITGGWDTGDNPAWTHENGSIWGRGANHSDFAFECYNQDPLSLEQTITDLTPGYYFASVQGYYRDGSRDVQVETIQAGVDPQLLGMFNAQGTAGEDLSIELPAVTSCIDAVPGIGWQSSLGRFPDSCTDACEYFQNGLYKVGGIVKVGDDGELTISVTKAGGVERDWVVVDNFRLAYLGENKPTGINGVVDETAAKDGKIYNINGMQVKDASQRGVYIKNGKKFVVK